MRLVAYHFRAPPDVRAVNLTDPHVRWGAVILADTAATHDDLVAVASRVASATVTSRVELGSNNLLNSPRLPGSQFTDAGLRSPSRLEFTRGAGPEAAAEVRLWNVTVKLQPSERLASSYTPDALSLHVSRNLTCSEVGGLRNQTASTSWNCLVSREVNGTAVVPSLLQVNGKPVPGV